MKDKKKLLIIVGIVLLLVLGVALYFVFTNTDKMDSSNNETPEDKIEAPAENTEELVEEMEVIKAETITEDEIVFAKEVELEVNQKVAVWLYSKPKFLGYFDVVEESNINRQIVANYNTIGLSKVDVLEKQIKEINPKCNVIKLNSFFDKDNLMLFSYNIDYIVDAIDSFTSKCLLIEKCIENNIQFISSMGAAKKLDPSKVSITKINKTSYDPLAKKIRTYFKNNNFYVVSSTEDTKCDELGSYFVVVETFGLLCAHHIITKIVGELKNWF